MIAWLHHLFDPHCPQCKDEEEDARQCKSCDILKEQLYIANEDKRRLLDLIVEKNKVQESLPLSDKQPIKSNYTPWKVKQQMLEAEDREKARILRENELEEKMHIKEEKKDAAGS